MSKKKRISGAQEDRKEKKNKLELKRERRIRTGFMFK